MPKSKQQNAASVVPKDPESPKRPAGGADASRFGSMSGASPGSPLSASNSPNSTTGGPRPPVKESLDKSPENRRRNAQVHRGGCLSVMKQAVQMEATRDPAPLEPFSPPVKSTGFNLEPPPDAPQKLHIVEPIHEPPTLLGHPRPRKLGDCATLPGEPEGEEMLLSEYARRRHIHPRLRWPRLASRGSDGSGSLDIPENLPADGPPSVLHSIANDADEGVDTFDGKTLLSSSGSTLYLGGSKRTGCTFDSCRNRTSPSPRSAILPRARSRQQPAPGTIATLYGGLDADDAGASLVSSLASLSSAGTGVSGASTASKVDRKWLMRMAPISCLPAQPASRAARLALQAEDEQGGGAKSLQSESVESGEYLNFERWGLGDDYLDCLLEAMCTEGGKTLKGIRHMNLSENRLTEDGIKVLMNYRVPEKLMSLNLSSNNLIERSAMAALRLIGKCHSLRELDLSRNALGDGIVEELCNNIEQCHALEGLGLANCGIGTSPRGGIALGILLSTCRELRSLDLHWNSLHGTGGNAFLRGLYDNGLEGCGKLRRLDLAFNRLGSGLHTDDAITKESDRNAKVLASVFQDCSTLFHLDISHNAFTADECSTLANGLLHNHTLFGLHMVGNDATIDDLGFVVPSTRRQPGPGGKPADGPGAQTSSPIPISTVPAGGVRAFDDEEGVPTIMGAESHRRLMNSCALNVPAKLKTENPSRVANADEHSNKLRLNPSLQCLSSEATVSMFSTEDLRQESSWVTDKSHVKTTADFVTKESAFLQRNMNSCWICENWVEHKVVYTPGISGDEVSADEVENAYALFSIDGFTRPTRLRMHEETHRRSVAHLHRRRKSVAASSFIAHGEHRKSVVLSQALLEGHGGHGGGGKRLSARGSTETIHHGSAVMRSSRCSAQPALTSTGKVVKWVGIRMLPPTMEPLQVIFVINGELAVANDMKKMTLPVPKLVTLTPDFQPDQETQRIEEIEEVNTLMVGYDAFEQLRRGRTAGVCVLEDPSNRTEFTVMPRQLVAAPDKKIQLAVWKYETSSFKDYPRFSFEDAAKIDSVIEPCFEADWNHTRLPGILKNTETRLAIINVLKPRYLSVMLLYMSWAFTGFEFSNRAVGLSFNLFRENLERHGGRGPGKVIDNQACKVNDVDCIFVAANVIDRSKKANFKVLPEKGLARFQFLEAVVRLAFRRFLGNKNHNWSTPDECSGAVSSLLGMLSSLEDEVNLRRQFNEEFFTEECCMVIKEHMETLRAVFDGYKSLFVYPGRSAKNISFGAWLQLLDDSGIIGEEFPRVMCGRSFALAKDIRPDCTSDWRHMELGWGEFLVALGAVIRLQPSWDKEFVADLLDEFITDYIDEAYSRLLERKNGTSRGTTMLGKSGLYDPSMQPIVNVLTKLFQDTDDDGSGTLDMREFRRAITSPHYKQELSRLGIMVTDINIIFKTADSDGSGTVTLPELIDCFVRLKTATKGLERAISYIRKAFLEADVDASGTLDMEEFHALFEQPNVVKKLASLGVSSDDVSELFDLIDKEGTGDITIEQVIEGFVFLRDPQNAVVRGVKILQKLFEEADLDDSGSLSREEVVETIGDPEISEKLENLKLQVPNWNTLFDELDIDGNGELSWEELSDGMTTYWARHNTA